MYKYFSSGRCLIHALCILCLSPLSAQVIVLQGTVFDKDQNTPIQGANIVLDALQVGAASNVAGFYSFTFEAPDTGRLELICTYLGYATYRKMVDWDGKSLNIKIDIYMESEALKLDQILISASKGAIQRIEDLTVSAETVKPQFVNLQASTNVTKILNLIPGLDEQDGQLSIRGSSGYAYGVGSRVVVALDGLPLLSADASSAMLDLIPLDNIARIEVLKGASSVLYGSGALGGIVNIITGGPGEKPRTTIRTRGALFDKPANESLDWDGSAIPNQGSLHFSHTRKIGMLDLGIQTDWIKDSGYRQGTDNKQFRGMLQTRYHVPSKPGLSLGLNVGTRIDSGGSALYWRSYSADTSLIIQGRDTLRKFTGGALTPTQDAGGYRKRLTFNLAIDPSLQYLSPRGGLIWYRGRYLQNGSKTNTQQDANNFILYNDLLYRNPLNKHFNLTTGISYSYTVANGDSLFNAGIDQGRHTGHSGAVYGQLDGNWPKLKANLGFRWEAARIDQLEWEAQPIVRAGINYLLAKGANIRASFGQAFRVPTVAERFTNTTGGGLIIAPNPNIKTERGYSLELGLRQGMGKSGTGWAWFGYLDLAAFLMRYNDMVEFGLDTVSFNVTNGQLKTNIEFTSINVTDARISGLELTGNQRLQWGKWTAEISGGITYTQPIDLNAIPENKRLDLSGYPKNIIKIFSDISNPEIQDRPEFLKYRSKYLVRANASVQYKKFGISANFRYKSFIESIDQYLYIVVDGLNDFRNSKKEGDNIWDLIAFYEINQRFQLMFNLDNVFNEEYLIIPGTLGPQRKFGLQTIIKL